MNSVKPTHDVDPQIEDAAGVEFMHRLRVAVDRIGPMSTAVAMAYAEGPEISGGLDIDPDDV